MNFGLLLLDQELTKTAATLPQSDERELIAERRACH